MGRAFTTSTRKSDGKPRKLRKATHPQAVWRQARQIMEHMGKRRTKGSVVHHRSGLSNRPGNIEVVSKGQNEREKHVGRKRAPTEPYLRGKKKRSR
jgi:hypothetical protein